VGAGFGARSVLSDGFGPDALAPGAAIFRFVLRRALAGRFFSGFEALRRFDPPDFVRAARDRGLAITLP